MSEVEKSFRNNPLEATTHQQDFAAYKIIVDQLTAIKDKFPFKLSKDYKTISFTKLHSHPGHYLELRYLTEKNCFQVEKHSLPDQCKRAFNGRTVEELLNSFIIELNNLEEFYGNLSDIDEVCFVIAPVPVTTKDRYRIFKFSEWRIFLKAILGDKSDFLPDEKVFLKVTLDPFVPSNVQLNFIGPLEEVESLRRIYCEKIDDLDVDESVHKNLLRIFDMLYFPYRPDCSSKLANKRTCSICFEFNLDNTYPIITCFNANCEVIFHSICLQKWFDTLTDTKTFCTVTSGLCPYCKQKLSMFIDIFEAGTAEN